MFNPHDRFQPRFIQAFQKARKFYLVSQTFKRGKDLFADETKEYLILTHYDDKGSANAHKDALIDDKYAALIDLQNEAHVKKLLEMLNPSSKYIVYSSLVPDPAAVERTINRLFETEIRTYIDTKLRWRIPANYTIQSELELIFGELFIQLSFGKRKEKVKLEDLEKI